MAEKTMICISTGDPSEIRISYLYWAGEMDGTWDHTVKEIADHSGLSSAQISKIVKENASLFVLDVRCATCGKPYIANSRTEFLQIRTRPSSACSECLDSKQKEEELRSAKLRKSQQERQNAIWLAETSHQSSFDYDGLDYLDACYAFVVLVNSEFDETSGEVDLVDPHSFSPDDGALMTVITHMHELGMLLFGKKTKPDAFLPGENERSYRYYPARISWRFAAPRHTGSYSKILVELCEITR